MVNEPPIDLLLNEFQALCYMWAHGKRTGEEVDAYKRRILRAIEEEKKNG